MVRVITFVLLAGFASCAFAAQPQDDNAVANDTKRTRTTDTILVYEQDYISIAKVGAANNIHSSYTYTSKGKPLRLLMPSEPGNYEIRYIMRQDRKVLASKPITSTP